MKTVIINGDERGWGVKMSPEERGRFLVAYFKAGEIFVDGQYDNLSDALKRKYELETASKYLVRIYVELIDEWERLKV